MSEEIVEKKNLLENELIIKDFSLAYGDNVLFENFTYTFKPGIYIFSGPSGVGKTTLMRFIAGLERRCTGEIIVNGVPLKQYSPKIHMVHQHYKNYPWLKAVENVLKVYEGHQKDVEPEDEVEARAIMTKLGLKDHLEKYPSQLSGGQKQRVSLSRAFVNKWSNVFLYDEPSSALDEANTLLVAEMIREHQKKFNTIEIVITHQDELEEALNGTILRFDKDFRIHPKKVSNAEVKQKKEGTVGKTFLKVVKAISSFFLKILNALKELLLQVILQLENDDQELQNVVNGSEKEKSKPHSVVAPEPTEKKS